MVTCKFVVKLDKQTKFLMDDDVIEPPTRNGEGPLMDSPDETPLTDSPDGGILQIGRAHV